MIEVIRLEDPRVLFILVIEVTRRGHARWLMGIVDDLAVSSNNDNSSNNDDDNENFL